MIFTKQNSRQIWKVWFHNGEFYPTKKVAETRIKEIQQMGHQVPGPERITVPVKSFELCEWLTASMREVTSSVRVRGIARDIGEFE